MALPGPHPDPPADLNSRTLPLIETAGVLVRSHLSIYDPIHFGRTGGSRFDAPAGQYGVLYVAEDIHGAFIETFGRQPGRMLVSLAELTRRSLSEVRSHRPLRLVDLSGAGLARLGADSRLATGSYAISQPWALALHEHPERPDGIRFRSRHDPSRICAALFDRVAGELNATAWGSLADPRHAGTLAALLDTYAYGLID